MGRTYCDNCGGEACYRCDVGGGGGHGDGDGDAVGSHNVSCREGRERAEDGGAAELARR